MIYAHILMNILFLLFLFFDVRLLFSKETISTIEKKVKRIVQVSFILGLITYLTYITLLTRFITSDGFDKQSLSLLTLSWAFMFAAHQVASKQLMISKK